MERCLACEAERGRHPWSAAYRRLTCAPDVGGRASSRAATGLRRGVRKTLDLLCTALREPLVAGTRRVMELGRRSICSVSPSANH